MNNSPSKKSNHVFEKPQFIISKKKVLEQYGLLKKLGLTISYSNKTNMHVGKVLEENTDCVFNIHSITGIEAITDRRRVWFFTQALQNQDLDKIFSLGISKFVVDNPDDLDVLLDYVSSHDLKIDLLLRMKLKENTIFTGKYFVFGMDSKLVNSKILELRNCKNIIRLGVHFHRKSQNVSEWALREEISDALMPEVLKSIDILDIGGGIPGKYKNTNDRAISNIFDKISELKNWLSTFNNIELMAEPGRIIAGPSARLQVTIISIYENNITVNASIFNSALDTVIANVKLIVLDELEHGNSSERYTIKGCTPASEDIFRYQVFLKDPQIGDSIVFLNAGAYNYTSDFCDLEKIETVVVEDF